MHPVGRALSVKWPTARPPTAVSVLFVWPDSGWRRHGRERAQRHRDAARSRRTVAPRAPTHLAHPTHRAAHSTSVHQRPALGLRRREQRAPARRGARPCASASSWRTKMLVACAIDDTMRPSVVLAIRSSHADPGDIADEAHLHVGGGHHQRPLPRRTARPALAHCVPASNAAPCQDARTRPSRPETTGAPSPRRSRLVSAS